MTHCLLAGHLNVSLHWVFTKRIYKILVILIHHKVSKMKCKLTNGERRLEFIETKHATHNYGKL